MNVKTAFGYVGDVIGGVGAVLAGLISVGVLSQIVFGTGWLGIDVIGNITDLVVSLGGAGLAGLVSVGIIYWIFTDNSPRA